MSIDNMSAAVWVHHYHREQKQVIIAEKTSQEQFVLAALDKPGRLKTQW